MFDEIKLNIIKMNERFIYVYIIIKNIWKWFIHFFFSQLLLKAKLKTIHNEKTLLDQRPPFNNSFQRDLLVLFKLKKNKEKKYKCEFCLNHDTTQYISELTWSYFVGTLPSEIAPNRQDDSDWFRRTISQSNITSHSLLTFW